MVTFIPCPFICNILCRLRKGDFIMSQAQTKSKGLLNSWFRSGFWNSKIRSANVTKKERFLGYCIGPFGVMLLQSIVNSYFNQYLTDVLGFTVNKGLWIASFMVIFPVVSKLLDAVTNVIMAKILDRTTCRQGKLRPWMILSLPIIVISIIMMFAIPEMDVKAMAIWVVIAFNLFYSVGYTMWYMAYEMSAALSTRNSKQRSGNSIIGQITKNVGTGMISIIFPTLLKAIAKGFSGGDMKQGYFVTLAFMCVIAVPLTFIQYFYTRERITEERRATELKGEDADLPAGRTEAAADIKSEASFGTQLKACLRDKYWVMFILMIMIYQILNALKSVSQVYYAGWVVHGNSYGTYEVVQRQFTMIAMAPVGPMLFIVVPLIKKMGRTKINIIGAVLATAGGLIAWLNPGHTLPVYLGTALSGIGSMAYIYTMMSFTGDAIDHVEYTQNIRTDGVTAAFVGFMHALSNGIGLGIFNAGLMASRYQTPQVISSYINKKGTEIQVFADQPASAVSWINFSYQGAIALTAVMFLVLFLFFFDIERRMPEVSEKLTERKKAECEAKGIPYVSPQEQQAAERKAQAEEAEANRVKELREHCEKKGLDFDTENQKYLAKAAAKKEKKAARKAKRTKK